MRFLGELRLSTNATSFIAFERLGDYRRGHVTGVVAGEADKLVEGVLDLLDPGKKSRGLLAITITARDQIAASGHTHRS